MKGIILLIIFFIYFPLFSQYGSVTPRREIISSIDEDRLNETLSVIDQRAESKKCLQFLSIVTNEGEGIDYFKPDNSTAIKSSFLISYNGLYYAMIVFTSSDKVYLYNTNLERWNSYKDAGIYSAGASFNRWIYPYKICDYIR